MTFVPPPPPGQGPIDPRGAFAPPPPPPGAPPGAVPTMAPPSPFGMMPPPYFMAPPVPPAPAAHGRSFARSIFMTLATSIFGLSIAGNVYLLLFSGLMSGGHSTTQNVLVRGDSKQKIAVFSLKGIIADDAVEQVNRFFTAIEGDANVKAVVLEVDSPGGTVTASDEIHHRIMRFKADRSLHVVVSQGSLAASGGYYVSCAADYIIAQPTTMTGNIGVLLPQYNVSRLFDKWGIEETTIESTGTPFKNAGSMFRPVAPEERAYMQGLADNAFRKFKSVVSNGRRDKLVQSLEVVANGKIYTADEAEKLGLVDEVGYLEDAYNKAATLAQLSNATVVRYGHAPSVRDLLGFSGPVPDRAAGSTVNIALDANLMHEMLTPRLMYLWRGS